MHCKKGIHFRRCRMEIMVYDNCRAERITLNVTYGIDEAYDLKFRKKRKSEKSKFIGDLKNHRILPTSNSKQSVPRSERVPLWKNIGFWALIGSLIGGAFGFGIYFGSNKFDIEKNNLYQQTISQRDTIDNLRKSLTISEE